MMHRSRIALVATALLLVVLPMATGMGGARAATSTWPTYHLDPTRTGNDLGEPLFATMRGAWTSGVLDGSVYAEPLVDGGIVIVATENDSVYGFNAASGGLQWGPVSLGAPRTSNFPCGDIVPLGITGTPVIDGGFLYVVGEVQTAPTTFRYRLAKLNPSTGAVTYNNDITPSGMDTNVQQERSALAVSNGAVVVTWGGLNGDCGNYHGYVETISESSGAIQAQWSDTVGGREGGIWGPSGAAVDASGNIYVTTGNGSSTSVTAYDDGDSVLRFTPSLTPPSFFAPGPPQTWASLNANDTDLGSVGPSLLTDGLLFAIGKGGRGYLLNPTRLPNNFNPGGGENFSAQVCHATQAAAFGGLAVSGNLVFVPCVDGIAAVSVDSTSSFHTVWYQSSGGGSAPILAGGVVWTMAMDGGTRLYGLAETTGQIIANLPLPATTTHFATPAAGDGMLFAAAGNRLTAFAPTFAPGGVGAPALAVEPGTSTQAVFWNGGGHLIESWFAAGSWNGPVDWTGGVFGGAGALASAPTAAITPGGAQVVFWEGAGGQLIEAWYAGGSWHGPVGVPGVTGSARLASAPAVAVSPDGSAQTVFWRSVLGHLEEEWYAGGRWNGPVDWTASAFAGAGGMLSAPTAAIAGDGTQVVFWQSTSGHLVEAWLSGGRWNGPVDWTAAAFGGASTLASAPGVALGPGGSQLVYWQGTGGHLVEAWYTGGWHGPLDLTAAVFGGAGPLTSPPSAAVIGGTQVIFWQGAGQTLWEAWFDGRWNGPVDYRAG